MSSHQQLPSPAPTVRTSQNATLERTKSHHSFARQHLTSPGRLESAITRADPKFFTPTNQLLPDLEIAVVQPEKSYETLNEDAPEHKQEHSPLPSKRYPRILRHLRYTILTVYRRLFTVVFLLNIIPLVQILTSSIINLDTLATAASTNFLGAILIRQDFAVKAIFRSAWLVPWSLPLRVRRWAARCYCYGGIHSGAAAAGTCWWIAFSTFLAIRFVRERLYTIPLVVFSSLIAGFLVGITILALPDMRKRWHNAFELTHRLMGWTAIALFWTQLMLLTHHQCSIPASASASASSKPSFATLLIHSPTFWNLTLITAMLVYPWLFLCQWTFTPEVLSPHAIRLHFPQRVPKMCFISISTSPLREWHPFAIFPSMTAEEAEGTGATDRGNSLIVSDAGDWTHNLILCAQQQQRQSQRPDQTSTGTPKAAPPLTLYVRTLPRPGVLSLTTLFPRTLLITTGSGIGPSLSSLLDRPPTQSIRLIWSTRSPLATYGPNMLSLVHRADPDALIIDTDRVGRPDLVEMAYREAQKMRAEAVFVLGNEGVTKRVVYGLEGRGVPAFGPVWDS
ncbi:hypothetical protein K458DRAFT_478409 [Lentithecium fluviatile CBS 122367]|uniref:Integral membrane protein TmpA n=1 Tax=Lentithecium fluviatile CBS 122367 TaxID=1168545 RepID=A0A6G1IY89_9PLEO|nr:hypothetical protein K458DRAFT_478409 [Lentithecium fluviatile CBS 122367]